MRAPLPSTPLLALDVVAVDIETTSLDSTQARILKIGAVTVRSGKAEMDKAFVRLVNPGVPIPAGATAVHGIADQLVASAPAIGEVLADFEAYVGKNLIVGHNVFYDFAVLRAEYARSKRDWPDYPALDLRMLARLVTPALARDDLPQLCGWLKLNCPELRSAATTARIFETLVPLLREKGIRTLAEATAASRPLIAEHFGLGIEDERLPRLPEAEMRSLSQIDSYPYRHLVGEVMSSPPFMAPEKATIQDAIRLMVLSGVSSMFVDDGDGSETGIVTERDLLRAIGEREEAALRIPVSAIATRPIISVEVDAFLYKAIARIDRYSLRHLAVKDRNGKLVGALTPRNLLRQRAASALVLGEDIEASETSAELGAALARLTNVARALVAEEVDPRRIAAVISSEFVAATRRASEIAEATMLADGWGAPPCRYAVLVMGSAARGESLLAADQDNAIVFAEGEPGSTTDQWFAELGTRLARYLDEAGVPYCKGGVMAKNAQWRHSVAGWKELIGSWVRRQRPEDLLNVDIFFDNVPVHGDKHLGDDIRAFAYEVGARSPDFLKLLTDVARNWQPPFTLLGGIRTDANGRVDLKKGGIMPIFTAARVLGIKHQLMDRSTPDRLRGFAKLGKGSASDIEHIIASHRTLLGTILEQQIIDSQAGIALSPNVAIERLSSEQRSELKKAIGEVKTAIDLVSEGRF